MSMGNGWPKRRIVPKESAVVKKEDSSLDDLEINADVVVGENEERHYRALVVEDEALHSPRYC